MSDVKKQIDEKSKKFIKAVEYYGGEATTTEIRQKTGLNHNEVSYRFNKLSDLELIDVTHADVGNGKRNPPKIAHLTGHTRREIERGLLGDVEEDSDSTGDVEVSEIEFNEMKDELESLQQRVDVLTQARTSKEGEGLTNDVKERLERLEKKFEDVRSQSTGDGDGVTPRQVAEAPAVKKLDKRVGELETDMLDLEEYMYEWHESAETYLRALRQVVEDKLGVSLQSYLEAGEDDLDEGDAAEES